jgi:hypothetical protein
MITSNDSAKLKLVRKLQERKHREREGLFATEGEDLLAAGLAAGAEPRFLLTAAGAELPPEWDGELTRAQRLAVFQRSLAAWVERCPALSGVKFSEENVDPGGGVIFAWGETGIEDHHSKLHDRYDIGVYSRGNYHSVNTGKFTTSPYMGLRTAERILGLA